MSSRKSSKKKSSKRSKKGGYDFDDITGGSARRKSSKKSGYDFDDITGGSEKKKSSKKSGSSKKRSSTPKTRSTKNGGVVSPQELANLNAMVAAGVYTRANANAIIANESTKPGNWTPPSSMINEFNKKQNAWATSLLNAPSTRQAQSQVMTVQGPRGPQGPPGESTTKYVLPITSILNPYDYSSYYNPLLRPTYTPPIKNLVMPQYKDRNIENQIHTYREHLNSINAWNNLYFEKMMAYGMSRVPYTTNEETKIHIKNYVTALILYGMNKIISDFELRNLIENGVRDALAYGENIKQGDSPVVIYKQYVDPSAAHPASITPDAEKERRKKKKSKKKKKLQKMKEMELLNEIKELMSQKKTSN